MPGHKHPADLEEQVIKTLLYFDIFSYPLKAEEVLAYLPINGTTLRDVSDSLDRLTKGKCLFRFGDLFSLHDNVGNITRRIKGNSEAVKWLKIARKRADFIARFPFVRAVMGSGSLSKGYMDENSDLDFFIVTAPNRLWVARTILVVYKRIFLFNSHKEFCINYFVDSTHLEIEEKNLFTATELASLIPLHNHEYYQSLLTSNDWLRRFLPNFTLKEPHALNARPSHSWRRFSEFILNPFAEALDKLFMWITLRRWRKIYRKKYDEMDFDIAFKTRRHVSKNHPNYYQKKVLELYSRKLSDYKYQHGQLTTYE